MADIFVCYARDDKDKVDPIVKALEGYNFSFYYDDEKEDKLSKNRWRDKIYNELVDAHCLLIILNNSTKMPHWMKEEKQMFINIHKKNNRKHICRIDIGNSLNKAVFPHTHYHINLTNWTGDLHSKEWQKFISSISQCLST